MPIAPQILFEDTAQCHAVQLCTPLALHPPGVRPVYLNGPRKLRVAAARAPKLTQATALSPWIDPEQPARELIRATCATMQTVDYFTLLGLPTDAPYLIMDRALRQLQAQFLPKAFSWWIRHEARWELRLIAQMLREARWVLGDAERRASYRAHMRPTVERQPQPHPQPIGQLRVAQR